MAHNSVNPAKVKDKGINLLRGALVVNRMIADGDERFTYVVTETFIVQAEDTGILDPVNAEGSLTLITCYPVGTTRQRFVVKAKRRD